MRLQNGRARSPMENAVRHLLEAACSFAVRFELQPCPAYGIRQLYSTSTNSALLDTSSFVTSSEFFQISYFPWWDERIFLSKLLKLIFSLHTPRRRFVLRSVVKLLSIRNMTSSFVNFPSYPYIWSRSAHTIFWCIWVFWRLTYDQVLTETWLSTTSEVDLAERTVLNAYNSHCRRSRKDASSRSAVLQYFTKVFSDFLEVLFIRDFLKFNGLLLSTKEYINWQKVPSISPNIISKFLMVFYENISIYQNDAKVWEIVIATC